MTEPLPYTREELRDALPRLARRIRETQDEFPDARPLPPMYADECLEALALFTAAAAERPLSKAECFLHGQLIAQLRMAVIAEFIGQRERCYVITESQFAAQMQAAGRER